MSGLVLVGIVGAIAMPLVTYLIAVKQFSGKIATSDASDLWEESRSIRDWSQRRIAELNGLVERLEHRLAEQEAQIDMLRTENAHLFQQVVDLEKENQ